MTSEEYQTSTRACHGPPARIQRESAIGSEEIEIDRLPSTRPLPDATHRDPPIVLVKAVALALSSILLAGAFFIGMFFDDATPSQANLYWAGLVLAVVVLGASALNPWIGLAAGLAELGLCLALASSMNGSPLRVLSLPTLPLAGISLITMAANILAILDIQLGAAGTGWEERGRFPYRRVALGLAVVAMPFTGMAIAAAIVGAVAYWHLRTAQALALALILVGGFGMIRALGSDGVSVGSFVALVLPLVMLWLLWRARPAA